VPERDRLSRNGAGSPWRRLAARALVAGTVLGVVGVGGPWVWVERASADRVYAADAAPSAPVALVLGAGLTPDGRPSPFLEGRLQVAKALYDSGRVRVLLVSGDNRFVDYDEPTAMRDWLVAHGIPEARIVRDFAGRDTYDSCVRATRIFGVTRALVVSQAYHLPRALAVCGAVGVDADGVGDWSAQQWRDTWTAGEAREKLAGVKAVFDVVTRPDPVLGRVETSVQEALAAS